MWCPNCGVEAGDGGERCADCGSELVPAPPEDVAIEQVSVAGRPVQIAGIDLECKHCGHDQFLKRKAQLNTAFLSFLDLDWLNQTGTVFVCGRCGFLHWFLPFDDDVKVGPVGALSVEGEPLVGEVMEVDPAAAAGSGVGGEPIGCLSCGSPIPAGERSCRACGWSYG